MPDQNLGWLIVFGSVGLMMYAGTLMNWYFSRFDLMDVCLKSIGVGGLLVAGYVLFGFLISEASIMDLLLLKVPFTEINKSISNKSFFPAHLVGYILIAGGILLFPFAIYLKIDRQPR